MVSVVDPPAPVKVKIPPLAELQPSLLVEFDTVMGKPPVPATVLPFTGKAV
jgi:hypothetical protein